MDYRDIYGKILIILGLIFIIFPLFNSEIVSLIVGLSLLFLGVSSIINAISTRNMENISKINIILGIISIIFGLLFIFAINALSFLVGMQFYIIAFVMIVFGIMGLISESSFSKISSLLILIIGILAVIIGSNTIAHPIYASILIGVCLIIQGLRFVIGNN